MFEVREIKDDEKYRKFLNSCPLATLQQSFVWADFQSKVPGRKESFALAVYDMKGKICLTALVSKLNLPWKKSYYYVQRGPLFDHEMPNLEDAFKALLDILKEFDTRLTKVEELVAEIAGRRYEYTGYVSFYMYYPKKLAENKYSGTYSFTIEVS